MHRADLYLRIAFLFEKFAIAVGTWSWLEHVTSKKDMGNHSVGGHPGDHRRTQWVKTSPTEEIGARINFIMRTGKSSMQEQSRKFFNLDIDLCMILTIVSFPLGGYPYSMFPASILTT